MSLASEIKYDIKAAKKIRFRWWAVLLGIVGSTLSAFLFDHFGRVDLDLPTLNCIAVLGFVLLVKWKLRQRVWFWITMIVIAALHVALILFVPWTTKWVPALVIAGIDSVDLIAMLAILSVVAKFMEGPNAPE